MDGGDDDQDRQASTLKATEPWSRHAALVFAKDFDASFATHAATAAVMLLSKPIDRIEIG